MLRNEKVRLTKELEESRQKLKQYTDLVERGVGIGTIIERFKQLEEEKQKLKKPHDKDVRKSFDSVSSQNLASMVSPFTRNFAENFEKVPIKERNLLIKQVISEIVVDRDAETVIVHVRKIPALSPDLEELLQNENVPADFACTRRSGGPNFPLLANLTEPRQSADDNLIRLTLCRSRNAHDREPSGPGDSATR